MTHANALKDKINNENIPEMASELKEERLQWLGHVERIDEERGPVEALHLKYVFLHVFFCTPYIFLYI